MGLVRKTVKPAIAERVDAIRILSLEVLTKYVSVKARLLMNIDIVNPMPPSKPIPARFFHVMPFCRLAIPALTNKNGRVKMPNSLPTTRPRTILRLQLLPSFSMNLRRKLRRNRLSSS